MNANARFPDTDQAAGLPPAPCFHIAFYQFARVDAPDALVSDLRQLTAGLLGSVLVAEEGINGVLAGSAAALDAFERALVSPGFHHGIFGAMVFKRSSARTPPFARMKVHRKAEIVALGLPGVDAVCRGGISVSPQAWRALLADARVVLLDNRNSFEYRLGHFRSAIDPNVSTFRDFAGFVAHHAPAWKAAGMRVAMYCTGGVRCEKTSAWIADFGLEVYQLEGGVLNYFQSMPDAARDWIGECFVFDNRIALDTHLQETATTAEQVYAAPEDAWRLARAQRLDAGT